MGALKQESQIVGESNMPRTSFLRFAVQYGPVVLGVTFTLVTPYYAQIRPEATPQETRRNETDKDGGSQEA